MISLALSLSVFLLVLSGGMATDVPFVFEVRPSVIGDYDTNQFEKINLSYLDSVGVLFTSTPVKGGYLDSSFVGANASASYTGKRIEDLTRIINARIEPDNAYVHDLALSLAAKQSGDHTIGQVCEIYSYLKYGNDSKKPWSYVDDPRGSDYFNYASKSLSAGNAAGSTGAGDCDDFAILMSSLIESIGGTTRIILARNNSFGNHAYAEVYLGQLNAQNNQVKDIIKWLEVKFDEDKIYTNIDTDSQDVWLNLDWSANHPGGPFYPADEHNILWIRDKLGKTPLKVSENSINVSKLIGLTPDKPSPQKQNTIVTWIANTSDPHNNQILYKFFLNGHPVSKWTRDSKWVWITNDTDIGDNQIEVQVRYEEHSAPEEFDGNKTTMFTIAKHNEKPIIITLNADKVSPQEVDENVTWTVESKDPENDPILYRFLANGKPMTNWSELNKWFWQTNNAYIGKNQIEAQVRDGNHAEQDGFDDSKSASFTIVVHMPLPESLDVAISDKIFLGIIILGSIIYLIIRRL